MSSQRSIALDVAKGIAIILVVYGHALRGIVGARVIAADADIVMSDYFIYTFHMPLLFLVSGILFNSYRVDGKISGFWWKRAKTIIYPYFLWSLIQGSIQVSLSHSSATNGSMDIADLGAILWNPISPFWFLYALFFCQAIWFGIQGRVRPDVAVAFGLTAFIALYLSAAPHTLQDVAYGFLYFSVGVWGARVDLLRRLPTGWLAAGVLLFAGLILTACCYALEVPERLSFVTAAAMLVAVLSLCRAAETNAPHSQFTRFLVLCGQCSMGIYMMHILVIGAMRLVATRGADIHSGLLLLPVLVIAAVLIPLGIQLVTIRLGIQELVGLPSSAKPPRRHDQQDRNRAQRT